MDTSQFPALERAVAASVAQRPTQTSAAALRTAYQAAAKLAIAFFVTKVGLHRVIVVVAEIAQEQANDALDFRRSSAFSEYERAHALLRRVADETTGLPEPGA
ncbi:MAG: hypothetical protein ABL982_00170 [Vicinamibacterales bacterium]